jgi:hypothetical protein
VVAPASSAFLKRTAPMEDPKPEPLMVKTDLFPAAICVGLMEVMAVAATALS